MRTASAIVGSRPLWRREYEQLVASGAFDGEHLELLQGALVVMSPQNAPHSFTCTAVFRALDRGIGDRAEVRSQCPLALTDIDEPEPDVMVVPLGDYRRALPTVALLVVEVADSTRAKDLGPKAALYAAAGVPEYWVFDLPSRRIVVHTDPGPDGYTTLRTVQAGALSPAVFPDVTLRVELLFP